MRTEGDAMPLSGWRRAAAFAVLLASPPALAVMFAAIGSVLPMIAAHFDADGSTSLGGAWAAQFTITMAAVGVIAGGLLGGVLVERAGVRPVLFASLLTYAVAGSAGLYLDSVWALFASRFLLGVAVAVFSTCAVTLVGAWFTGVARARMLGFQAAVGGLGGVSALLLGGWLAEDGNWRAPFALYLAILPILLLAIAVIPAAAAPPRMAPSPGDRARLIALWPIYLLALLLFTTYFMTSLQLTFLLADDGVMSPFVRSLMIAIGVVAGALAGFAYGPLFRRLGPERIRLLLIVLMATGFLLIGVGRELWLIGLGAFLCGGGGAMINPHIEGLVLQRVPPALRSRAVGFIFTALYAADFINPLVVTPLREPLGLHGVFFGMGVLMLLGALLAWRGVLRAPAAAQPAKS